MEKFREFIIKLAETCPNAPSNPAHKTLLQDRLNQWFSEYKTPDHPPYSAMIERALSELNEKKGSTEDEISQFIIKEYDALPWAHLTLLEHHLEILCKSGDIVLTRGKRYMLAGENTFLTSSTKGKKKKRKRKSRWAWERDENKQRKKRNKGNRVDSIKEHKESDEKLTENDVNSEEKQNEGMMAVNEMEHSRDMPQELEIKPSEIMNGYICGAGKEEKQEEGQTNNNQLAVSSPERPPGFESIIAENLSDSVIFLRTCLSSQEQSIVVGERELLDLPIDNKQLDSPRPSVHDLSKSENSLELTELPESKRSSEAHEMAVSAQERNPESVEVHETVSNTSLVSYSPKEEAIPNVQIPRWQSGIVSASAEEISTSKRMERQLRRWSLRSPKAVDITGQCTSSKSNHHQLSDVEMTHDQWKESVSFPNSEQHLLHEKKQCELLEADVVELVQPVTTESRPREIKVYSRRTKTRPEQSKNTIQVVPMKSDVNLFEPNPTVGSQNSSMNEREPQELLQQPPSLQGETLQDKQSHGEDVNLIDVLQPEHQPEECQKTVLKRRGRLPKHKLGRGICKILSPSLCQEMIHANQEPPSLQGETLQDKPLHDEDANLIDVLQLGHQPEECQKTVLKRQGRPPKHKLGRGICKILSPSLCQEMIHANQQHQEPPKRQTRQRQQKENADDLLLLSDFAPKLRLGRPRKR